MMRHEASEGLRCVISAQGLEHGFVGIRTAVAEKGNHLFCFNVNMEIKKKKKVFCSTNLRTIDVVRLGARAVLKLAPHSRNYRAANCTFQACDFLMFLNSSAQIISKSKFGARRAWRALIVHRHR